MGFIDRPQNVSWRKAVFQVHLWSGVIVALYIAAISISGSILVFETNLLDERPKLLQNDVPHEIDYSKVVSAAQNAFAGEPVASVDMRTGDRQIVTVVLKAGEHQRTVYVNAASNEVVGTYIQEQRHGLLLWLEDFHNELASGRTGGIVNGIGGAILALLCATGIIIWWPGIQSWRRALGVNWKARWVRINYDLHSAIGFWMLLFVLMWGATGAYFIFPQAVQNAFGLFQQEKLAPVTSWRPGQKLLSAGDYVNAAKRAVPNEKLAFLYMDVFRAHGQVTAFLNTHPSVALTLHEEVVHMDPGTAKILLVEGTREWSFAERIMLATYSVHFGDFGGVYSKVLWSVLGLTPAVLAITGCLMWWNRYLSKQWRAAFAQRKKLPVY
jgi:uncharacterized iron-regulated membrane protein